MKVKAISRPVSTSVPVGTSSVPQPRNLNPDVHPFEKAREYTRALNATKLEAMFAKPFLRQLGKGHIEGVYTMAKDLRSLNGIVSGSGDGIVKVWNLSSHDDELWSVKAHDNIVRGVVYTRDQGGLANGKVLSCASDKTVKLWDPSLPTKHPVAIYLGSESFNALSHHRYEAVFATASSSVNIWDISRSSPVNTMTFGSDTLTTVKFNPIEASLLASAGGTDRTLTVYDIRMTTPLHKIITTLKSNSISWNPIEAMNFAVASEDHNVYLFDMRNLKRALNVLKDHVHAVMDVDYSPTGQEVVSASYDRTIRIFRIKEGHSRDVYHTSRMQRVFSAMFTMDSRYVLSGSDDGNIRIWRANASGRSGLKSAKERQKLEYDEALRERYKHMPEIRRIRRHRHLPKVVKKAAEVKRIEEGSLKKKEENVIRHSKPDSVRRKPQREKIVYNTHVKR